MNVSRQAITKWENDGGLPDVSNLQELSKVFGITIDYLLDNNNDLPLMVMKKQINKEKYKNKISSYSEILKENYPSPWEIYVLSKNPKMNKIESILNLLTGGDYYLIKDIKDISPYYLVTKNNLKILVNIKDWTLEVNELPSKTNIKDIKRLNSLKEHLDSEYYRAAIKCWTERDPEKRMVAKINQLNYVELWSFDEAIEFIKSL